MASALSAGFNYDANNRSLNVDINCIRSTDIDQLCDNMYFYLLILL